MDIRSLATSLRKIGVTDLANVDRAAKAAEQAHEKKLAHELKHADASTLAKLRAIIGEPGAAGVTPSRTKLPLQMPCRSPEAARAAAIYLPKDKEISRPLERFLVHVARLHDDLSGDKAQAMLDDPRVGEGVRKHLFMLEALVRFYAPRGPEKKMERARLLTKELEDRLGWNGDAINEKKAGPSETSERFAKHARHAHDELVAVLEGAKGFESRDADGWRVEDGKIPALQELVDIARKIDFGSEKQDASFARARLAELCQDVKADDLDLHNLEDGVHKLRRNLRWIPITLIALDGLVTLDDKPGPLPELEKLRDDPVAKGPFARLPVSDFDKHHIAIPWTLFLGLSKHIADLGELKDRGMKIEVVKQAIERDEKLDENHAKQKAEKLAGDPGGLAQVEADATKLRADLDDSGLLEALERAFRVGRG